ncbi:MAG TPA: hypothetical protein PL090_08660 [Syntrophales bacterium]|nr:hypothetical protein [Syntrophales bacterium]
MRKKLLLACLVSLFVCLSFPALAPAADRADGYGQIRALEQRGVEVTALKNRFLTHVLDAYQVPYERNPDGMVVRIQVESLWHRIEAVEIVPVALREGETLDVTGHEIFFYTDGGVFHIVTPLTAR